MQRLGMVSSTLLPDDSTNDEELEESSQETPIKPPKRSMPLHCKCKGPCMSLCGCAKRKDTCKSSCGCPADCANRSKDMFAPSDRRGTFTVPHQNDSNESEMPDENASVVSYHYLLVIFDDILYLIQAMNQTFCLKTDSSVGSDNSDTKSPVHCTLLASQRRLTMGRPGRPGYFKPVFDDQESQ